MSNKCGKHVTLLKDSVRNLAPSRAVYADEEEAAARTVRSTHSRRTMMWPPKMILVLLKGTVMSEDLTVAV